MRDSKGIYQNQIKKSELFKRALWLVASFILFRPFPTKLFRKWNLFVLRMFGARIGKHSVVHSSCRIQSPWNLILGKNACIGPYCVIENDAVVELKDNSVVSQYSYLCTSSHDIYHLSHDLVYSPITVGENAWVAAGAFIGKGVTIGDGAVVAARSVVVKNVDNWTIVGGNPSMFIKKRILDC